MNTNLEFIKGKKPLSGVYDGKINTWIKGTSVDSILKRIFIEYSGEAYSFQCRVQLLIWGEKMIALVVGLVGECFSEPS